MLFKESLLENTNVTRTPVRRVPAVDPAEVAQARAALLRPGYLNVHVAMPCPLKVPFKQAFKSVVTQWNADSGKIPVHSPQVSDCTPEGVERMLTEAQTPADLPDILVGGGLNLVFGRQFRRRFLDTGLFGGVPVSCYGPDYGPNLRQAAERFGVGFLGFSSWGVLRDLTVDCDVPVPTRWMDLTSPAYQGLVSAHGCHGHALTLALLLDLQRDGGNESLRQLARNIHWVGHFPEMIKTMGSSRSVTPFYALPNVAMAVIPSDKRVEFLSLNRNILGPLMILVNQESLDRCEHVIRYFLGPEFQALLERGAYFQPRDISGIEEHEFYDLALMAEHSFEEVTLLQEGFADLMGDKIARRSELRIG